jgi:hypothetical protein
MTKMLNETIAAETQGLGPLSATEIDCVSGGATLKLASAVHDRMSVEETKRLELAQRLEKSYANTHPHEYYGYRI